MYSEGFTEVTLCAAVSFVGKSCCLINTAQKGFTAKDCSRKINM